MEIGNEISQKIRSAIKAKLVDLGAYVDDELPDYIMVMVANKKTKEQMTDDLNLFLGNNTEKFTSWLIALLDKLNSLSESGTVSAAPSKANETATVAQPKEIANESNSKPEIVKQDTEGTTTKRQTVHATANKKGEKPNTDNTTQRKRTSAEHKATGEPAKKRILVEEESKHVAMKDVEIEITPSRDELEDVTEELPKRRRLGPIVRTPQPHKTVKSPPQTVVTAPSAESVQKPEETVNKAKKDTGQTVNHSTSKEPESERQSVSSRLGRLRNKSLTSAIGAIVKHPPPEEEDEEYDPHKPFIGNVASVVKVTERKSTVPVAWQADKSILLKAITAAQDSIEKSSKKTEKAIVHPTVQKSTSSREHRREIHKRLGDRSQGSRPSMRSDRLEDRRSPVRIQSRSARSERPTAPRQRSRVSADQKTNNSSQQQKHSKSERSIKVFQKAKEENDDVFDNLKSKISAHKKSLHSNEEKKGTSALNNSESATVTSLTDDCRVIEYDPEEKTAPKCSVPQYKSSLTAQSALTTLVESGAEESDFTDGEGDDNRIIQERERDNRQELSPTGPKFVVTLDGVDPEMLRTDIMSDSDFDMEDVDKTESNIVRVEPRPQIPVLPQIQPITVNLGQDEDGEYEKNEVTEPSKSTERCRFFPGCKNGEACPFFHPKEPCSKFPQCKFGDQCMFIHPVCKFDSACLRPDCIFAHTTKRPRSPLTQPVPVVIQPVKVPIFYPGSKPPKPPSANKHPSEIKCKFFPKCTNMNCPFNHPTPCRFGIACNNKATCRFTHPKLPSKKELSWSSKSKPPSKPEEANSAVTVKP